MMAMASAPCNSVNLTEDEAGTTREHITFLIEFLESEYATTLHKVRNFVQHSEITYDLLWAIFIPGDMIFARCKTTGEPRAFRLLNVQPDSHWLTHAIFWSLTCEYVEASDQPLTTGEQFGLATYRIKIDHFDGVRRITELDAYPIKYHAHEVDILQKLTHRGQEWAKLRGVHHRQYNGSAYKHSDEKSESVQVNGRIMIDRDTFGKIEPNYSRPNPRKGFLRELWDVWEGKETPVAKLTRPLDGKSFKDDDLVLATPIVYGFSYTEKRWLEFNIEYVTYIEWNDEGFKNLAIDPDRRLLIQALVQSHANLREKGSVDDFVPGKGVGLVINLFGPPGVGKTLTVEATSEHLRKPLYVVSAGDLGTSPTDLDRELTKIFSLVPRWDAIVLIDEADVFLQERGTADVERNAMVAVFLRQLEYFQGILFLTTNRVKQFDPAFQSRIHLSLHYSDLSPSEKEQLWCAFLEKARTVGLGLRDLSAQQLRTLSRRNVNGRQIKNIVNLAVALAGEEQKPLSYAHLVRTMSVTDDWRSNELTILPPYQGAFWSLAAVSGILFCVAANWRI
ncbi:P-loop containing nucleoside triphosphate hydrolase protein [Mycena epipterygia]|nr:P-loop containing nucleoside triphosphate hydrolase protein [Mycena epipterygia]